jgi:hypothetical protein
MSKKCYAGECMSKCMCEVGCMFFVSAIPPKKRIHILDALRDVDFGKKRDRKYIELVEKIRPPRVPNKAQDFYYVMLRCGVRLDVEYPLGMPKGGVPTDKPKKSNPSPTLKQKKKKKEIRQRQTKTERHRERINSVLEREHQLYLQRQTQAQFVRVGDGKTTNRPRTKFSRTRCG